MLMLFSLTFEMGIEYELHLCSDQLLVVQAKQSITRVQVGILTRFGSGEECSVAPDT
jgi:hypothetical protein